MFVLNLWYFVSYDFMILLLFLDVRSFYFIP